MRTSTSRPFILLVSVAALVGLMLGAAWRADAKKTGGKGAAHASAPDCKKDDDCVMVTDDCCSCNQGGKARAIPKKQKDAYEKDRKKRCKDTECIEMMSQDPSCSQKPFCAAGICELGDSEASPSP